MLKNLKSLKFIFGFLLFVIICSFITFYLKYNLYIRSKSKKISNTQINFKVIRIDKILFETFVNPQYTNKNEFLKTELNKYSEISKFFFNIIKNDISDNNYKGLYEHLKDPKIQKLYRESKCINSELKKLEKDLTQAFKAIKFYFPAINIPIVFFFNTGMSIDIFCNENIIVVDPSMFMGNKSNYRPLLPKYQLKFYTTEFLLIKILFAFILKNIVKYDKYDKSLLNNMLRYGKVYFVLKLILPNRTEKDILEYTIQQYNYLYQNKSYIWDFILNSKILFNSKFETKRIYINDSPFTVTINKQCPGRIGRWLGLKIIENYVNAINSKYYLPLTLFYLFDSTQYIYQYFMPQDIKSLIDMTDHNDIFINSKFI